LYTINLKPTLYCVHTCCAALLFQGMDRWAGGALFDPSDAGAAGFYSLNAYNSWWVVSP
jgi:hypothetical protein